MATLSGIITPSNVETASSTSTLTNKTINLTSNTLVATSAQLAAAVTDETGSGALVFATSPTLVTPVLGTPQSGTLTNATGLPIVAGTTGTLSVARGGTGLTALGTAAQVLRVNSGATALEFATPATPASGLTLLATATASTSATIDLETGIGSTYDHYVIMFDGVRPTQNSQSLRVRLKVGGSYAEGSYAFVDGYLDPDSASLGVDNSASSDGIMITRALSTTAGYAAQGAVHFSLPANTSLNKTINAYSNRFGQLHMAYGHYAASTAALTGVRFYFASGNISEGNFRLYGYQKT